MSIMHLTTTYNSQLSLLDTEIAIKFIKDTFERELAKNLNLTRVSAPLFVDPRTGLNDNLNGVERRVTFNLKNHVDNLEIVQSLAKWKRMALKKYGFVPGTGLYTDMNAIRCDEDLDNLHSAYVDQWDWEKIINKEDRDLPFLKKTVQRIYKSMLSVEEKVFKKYPALDPVLPQHIKFISTLDLYKRYPGLSAKERENAITREFGAVFLYQIGWPLPNNLAHDGRAADYDDWNLNGDIIVWYEPLQLAFEISSMGIRVDRKSLVEQLKHRHEEDKLDLPYGKSILNDELPLTIGGGIGQSRLCMFFLKKIHIGEVQSSVWDEDDLDILKRHNISLL